MLVGFIAIIVILLVIIGVMSTGATSGSGGVDQTKATKLVSELSGIAQSVGFFKTTTTNGDYDGITLDKVATAGIVELESMGSGYKDAAGVEVADANYIKSNAVNGVFYNVKPHKNADNTVAKGNFDVDVYVNENELGSQSKGLNQAIETALTKFGAANVDTGTTDATDAKASDGAATVTFK
jgi:hypothetical protein